MDRKRGHGRESGKSATLHRMTSERHCTVVKGALTSDAYFIFALGSVALLRFRYRYHVSDHDHLCYQNGVRFAGVGPGPSISCHRAGTGFHMAGTRYVRVPLCPIGANPPPVSILLERIPDWGYKALMYLDSCHDGYYPRQKHDSPGPTAAYPRVPCRSGDTPRWPYCRIVLQHTLTYLLTR